ncbi:MAG: hypothetical protein GF310_01675 [candidate division Zixibacteria bacterium]|nr:hypothetical protein [candidate division Zixibacteria bacterium]
MKRHSISIIIILLSCYTSGLTAQSVYSFEPGDIEVKTEIKLEPKSHFWGAFYSVIPGVALHGTGLLYAEEYTKAGIIMAVEGLSLYLIGLGIQGTERRAGCVIYYDTNAAFYGLIGLGLFAATWIYDVVMTQRAIHEHNESIKHRNLWLDIGTLENSNGRTLTFGFSWRF